MTLLKNGLVSEKFLQTIPSKSETLNVTYFHVFNVKIKMPLILMLTKCFQSLKSRPKRLSGLFSQHQFHIKNRKLSHFYFSLTSVSVSGGTSGKELGWQRRRRKRSRFDPWGGKIPLRRAWHPPPVFFPGETLDRGAWWSTVHRVAKSQTQLK